MMHVDLDTEDSVVNGSDRRSYFSPAALSGFIDEMRILDVSSAEVITHRIV